MSGFRITTLRAYLAVDPEDGDEGVCGVLGPSGWVAMICADEARFLSLRPAAEQIARETGRKIVVARFDVRTDEEEILP